MNHKVSIIIPCYNSANYIGQAIDSVIEQMYTDWELIIVDDCSTDESFEIIEFYLKKVKSIFYFKTDFTSGSPAVPRNIGIANASGRYIAFLDSDDVWLPNKLLIQIPIFEKDNVAIVFSDYYKFSEEKDFCCLIKSHGVRNYKTLLYGNEMGCSTVIYDTKKVGKCYFPKIHHEDFSLWLSILKCGYVAYNSGKGLVKYRISENSVSSNKFKTIFWVWNIYYNIESLGFFNSLFYSSIALFRSLLKYLK